MPRVMQMPPPPPLLLTKRVTSFLRANLSPHIHSAMLTTPAGSLLAHASNLPATALRRQAAVAASLWALQGPSNTSPNPEPSTASIPGSTVRTRKSGKHAQPTVTVQLDSGAVFVIRRLRCGMLFICMGGAEVAAGDRLTPTPAPHITRLSRSPAPIIRTPPAQDQPAGTKAPTTEQQTGQSTTAPRPSTPPQQIPTITTRATNPPITNTSTPTQAPTSPPPRIQKSPSQASILTTNTTGGASTTSTTTLSGSSNVSLMRRQVEELARWLDERLGGLCVPEEGIGISSPGHGAVVGNGNRGGSGNGLAVR